MNAIDYLHYESGSFYIFDRGYVDFDRLYRANGLEYRFSNLIELYMEPGIAYYFKDGSE